MQKLEFARFENGARVMAGFNPQSEEGGWVPVGDVTASVHKLERERDEALARAVAAEDALVTLRESISALAN